jgi:hypothetical protein
MQLNKTSKATTKAPSHQVMEQKPEIIPVLHLFIASVVLVVMHSNLVLILQAADNALFQLPADSLRAAPQCVGSYFQTLSELFPPVYFSLFVLPVILQYRLAALKRQLHETPLETNVQALLPFRLNSRCCSRQMVSGCHPGSFLPLPSLEQNKPGHPVAIGADFLDKLALIDLAYDAIYGFVGAFLGKGGSAPVEKLYEHQAQALIFDSGAGRVRIKARQKPCEGFGTQRPS